MRSSLNKLTLLITIFPLIVGLTLASIGIIDLNTANEIPEPKPNNAYGVLAFSSGQCSGLDGGIILQEIKLKENIINIKIDSGFFLESKFETPYEVTFGFQVPGVCDQPSFNINGVDKGTKETITEFVILEEKLVAFEAEETSLIYVKFMALPNCVEYRIVAQSNLRGLVSKRSFSTYDVTIPFSTTDSYLLARSGLGVASVSGMKWGCSMFVPLGTELKWALPYPDSQQVWLPFTDDGTPISESFTSFFWDARGRGFDQGSNDVRSDAISVILELIIDNKLQGRLFFDSGLYMGLGVSLLISGLYELLKVLTRMRSSHQVGEATIYDD